MIYTVTFNPAIDYVVRLDSPLEVGEVNRARGEDCVLGGKGINVSGVLAELGCKSVALGFVAGETGAWLERGLAAQGIQTDFIHLAQGMTRINVKIKAGQETELNGAGPDIPEAAMQALEKKLDALQKDDILVLAGSIPASLAQTTYERLLARNGITAEHIAELARELQGKPPIDFPQETAMGALALYISEESVVHFQPMNVNFGLIPPLGYRVKGKRNKNAELSKRALEALEKLDLS